MFRQSCFQFPTGLISFYLTVQKETGPVGSVEEIATRIEIRLRGIERAIQNQPSQEVLSNFKQGLLTLELLCNFTIIFSMEFDYRNLPIS